MTVISDGTTDLTPQLVLGWQSTQNARTVVHPVIGRPDPDVTLRPHTPRTGQLRMLTLNEADAHALAALHTQGLVLTLTDTDLPALGMSYVASGPVTVALDDATRRRWVVTVDYTEVTP